MIRTILAPAAALTVLAAATTAQVSPAYLAKAEGNYYANQPFGNSNANGYRYLQIHDDLKGKSQLIRGLAFRREGNATNTPFMAFSIRLSIHCSTAATTAATVSTTFDANHGGNKQTVLANQVVLFPPTQPGYCPMPFDYALAFSTPYAFDGANGGLCWEVAITQQTNLLTNVYFDFHYSQSTNPQAETDTFGEGCYHSTRFRPAAATCTTSFNWPAETGTLYLNGSELPPTSVVVGIIGFSRVSYGPFPLPWTFPGSATSYSGPCNLYCSLDLLLPGGANTNGDAQVSLPIPLDPATMNGLLLYGQFLAPDQVTRAAIPWISTNGTIWNFVAPYGLTPGAYVLASSTYATTGSVEKNRMYVTELR